MTATIVTKNWRGTYVARCTINDRGTLDREWATITDKPRKGSPMRGYGDLEVGWYETREGYRTHKGELTPKTYYRVDGLTARVIDFETFARAIQGPLPGQAGEHGDTQCRCGAEVATYTPDGFPRCEQHSTADDKAAAGLEVPL